MTRTSSKMQPLEYASSPVEWAPHAYQRRAVKFCLERAVRGLFLDPGLGKTSITLMVQKMLIKQRVARVTLVIAPMRVCHSVWPKEVKKWKQFQDMTVKVLHGPRKDEILESAEDGDILCINPEGLDWLFGVTKRRGRNNKVIISVDPRRVRWLFGTIGLTDLVVDESTKFKHSSSQKFKVLREVLSKFHRRLILTGTPAPNGLLDLFGQIFIIDLGKALGQYITHYRKMFFTPKGFGGFTWVPQAGAKELIYKELKKLVLRLDAKDYLDMPKVIPNDIRFDLPDAAREVYDSMEDQMVADIDDKGVAVALNAGSSMTKCAQIANGGLYRQKDPLTASKRRKNDGWDLIHNAKDDIVADLVEELSGQPVIIAYEFDHDLDRLKAIFGKDTPHIGGGVSVNEGKRIENEWNRGRISVLLLQPASVAHGLNLQEASDEEVGHVIWYGLTFDYENYDQLIRRIVRQGSKHKRVIVHHVIARDTVDEAKIMAVRRKEKTQNGLLDALRTYVKDRARRRVVTKSRKAAPVAHAKKRPAQPAKASRRRA
jgi:SNF2 family DNA or RNA helicase